jgi:hypothetical protein
MTTRTRSCFALGPVGPIGKLATSPSPEPWRFSHYPSAATVRAPRPSLSKFPLRILLRGGGPATRLLRRDLLSRSCPSGVEASLSETNVKWGRRVVHGDKEVNEKLGRNDPCPCGSGRMFKRCCRNSGFFSTGFRGTITSDRA